MNNTTHLELLKGNADVKSSLISFLSALLALVL